MGLTLQEIKEQLDLLEDKRLSKFLTDKFEIMLSDDAWEADDELPSLTSLLSLLAVLKLFDCKEIFGLGTNGRGSIIVYANDLYIDFLQDGRIRHNVFKR